MADIYWKSDEQNITFTAQLKDGSEDMDLTDATEVKFIIGGIATYTAEIEDANDGIVEVTIPSAPSAGTYYGEYEVTFSNGQMISFPSAANIEIRVTESLEEI